MPWSLVLASTCQRGKEKDWIRWQAGMQYGIRSEQAIEKVCREVGEHFSVVASERQPPCVVGLEAHRPLLPVSTDTVQMVNCQYRMSSFIVHVL